MTKQYAPDYKRLYKKLSADHLLSLERVEELERPIPMLLTCPMRECGKRHIDQGEFREKPHHTHACQFCGHVWRPSLQNTIGVQFLPGFKNGEK